MLGSAKIAVTYRIYFDIAIRKCIIRGIGKVEQIIKADR